MSFSIYLRISGPLEKRVPAPGDQRFAPRSPTARQHTGRYNIDRLLWLDATIGDSGSGHGGRAAYKSSYMKQNFTRAEAKCIYKHLTRTVPGVDLRGSVMAVDSYGGAVNVKGTAEVTSVWQRSLDHEGTVSAILGPRRKKMRAACSGCGSSTPELYSLHVDPRYAGTPYPNDYYEGCYINYPDSDMLAYTFWPQVYYGTRGFTLFCSR